MLFSVIKASSGLTVLMGNIGCYVQQITKADKNICTKLHVWGCFSWNDVGLLKRIECSMDAKLYQASIVNDIDVVAKCLVFPEKNFVFQQDLAPPHGASSTNNYFKSKNIQVLEILRILTQSKIYGLTLNVQCNKLCSLTSLVFIVSKVLSKSGGIYVEASQICYQYERASH